VTAEAILIASSTITCAHSGLVKPDTTTRLKVGGQPALLADPTGKSVSGCLTVDDTSHGIKHCTSLSSVTVGKKSRLTVGGRSVLLASLAGFTDGTPPPPPAGIPIPPAAPNQTRVRAAAGVA
jgi:hypothetical protein